MQHFSVLLSSITFRDPTNQAVSRRLVKEVHGLNPTFDAADIRSKLTQWYSGLLYIIQFPLSPCLSTSYIVAAYTYYKTLRQEQSLQRREVSNQRKKQRRRRERIARVIILSENTHEHVHICRLVTLV